MKEKPTNHIALIGMVVIGPISSLGIAGAIHAIFGYVAWWYFLFYDSVPFGVG